jgi:ribosomal protein S18 acetylase RimI-like enzyme
MDGDNSQDIEKMTFFRPLPWDTKVYDLNFFELFDLDKALFRNSEKKLIRDKKPGVVFAKLPSAPVENVRFLENNGFTFSEAQLNLEIKRFNKIPKAPLRFTLKPLSKRDSLDPVLDVCHTAFDTNRYILDPDLNPDLAGHRYANWVKNSIENENVRVVEYVVKEKPVGFFMVSIEGSGAVGHYLLGGVHPSFKGRGFFYHMIEDMLSYLHQNFGQMTLVDTCVSLNNRVALNIYLRLGFTVGSETIVLCKKYN